MANPFATPKNFNPYAPQPPGWSDLILFLLLLVLAAILIHTT